MKILITNTVALNSGDAAILMSLVRLLKREFGQDADISVLDARPETARRYYPETVFLPWLSAGVRKRRRIPFLGGTMAALYRRRLRLAAGRLHQSGRLPKMLVASSQRRSFQALHEADLVVATGGTYLVENYNLKGLGFEFGFVLDAGKPLVLFTQSLGPFHKPENRRIVKQIVDHALLVLLRDERSRKQLLELGADPGKLHTTADAAFALRPPDDAPRFDRPIPLGSRMRIAVSVRAWAHFQTVDPQTGQARFEAAVRSAVHELVAAHDAEVVFVSTCQGVPEYADDAATARRIVEGLTAGTRGRVSIDDAFHTPDDLIDMLGRFDLVIATRMHAGILALVAGTPVLPIAYEFKTVELFQRLGLGRYVQDIERVDGAGLVAALNAFLQDLPALRPTLQAAVAKEMARAPEAGTQLRHAYDMAVTREASTE